MEKKDHLSVHQPELMGLILKFQSWSENKADSTGQMETDNNIAPQGAAEPKLSQEKPPEESGAGNEDEGDDDTDEEEQPLVDFNTPKRFGNIAYQ